MKKLILTLSCSAIIAGGVSAQVTTPTYFSENFIEMGQKSDYVVEPWTMYGVDVPVIDILQQFFPDDDPNVAPYFILTYGSISIPMCSTNFSPSTEADQWLITPTITVPEDADNSVLSFTVCVYGGSAGLGIGDNPVDIYVSTTGVAKEDFGEPIYSGAVKGSATSEMVQKQFCIPVNGFAGKDIHLAFVARGKNVGLTGFTNISMGNYYVSIDNSTPDIGEVGNKYTAKFNVKLKAPVACPGIKVVPYINDVAQEEIYYKKAFGPIATNPAPSLQMVQLKDFFEIKDKNALNYKFEIIPDYENAATTTLVGTIGVPQFEYLSNVVIEEVTASGCGWCPSGMASLDYYHENYPGTETVGKAISIGVHGQMNYYDPMMDGVAEYVSKLMDLNSYTGMPQAMFNRNSTALTPDKRSEFERQIALVSYNKADIVEVSVPLLAEGETMHGREVKVKFDVKNAFTAQGVDLSAAVVLIENDVRGNTEGYNQENNFYNRNSSFIVANYGEWLAPYMTKFLSGGEWGQASIPYDQMVYQHVARGIYPDFYGQRLNTEWEGDEAQQYEMTFTVPNTIQNWDNVEVIVLVMKNGSSNGKVTCPIVGSDIMAADKFITSVSGVKGVAADDKTITRAGDNIVVNAEVGSIASLYNVEGMLLGRYTVGGEQLVINATDLNGIVIVKVDGANANVTGKLVF